jgi:hydroxypyruvate reductase
LRVVAAGKAAEGMLRAVLGSPAHPVLAAVVAAPGPAPADLARDARIGWHRGGHPLPDAGSLAAGAAVAALVDRAPPDARFLVLLSGGASALLELPAPGVTLERLRQANAGWLAGGLAIDAVNRERAALSMLKGGGLARRLGPRPTTVLFVSDVLGDDPRTVGSGPCWDAAAAEPIAHRCVAANRDARAALAGFGRRSGIAVHDHGALEGDATAQGARLATELRTAAPGLHAWGGECNVRLPADSGRGGRCQQLALAAVAAGLAPGVALLACGSDGRDGPDPRWRVAGALVDGGSAARLADAGFDPAEALVRCDAGTALEAAGDLVDTGPTGTNVADLVIAWRPQDGG